MTMLRTNELIRDFTLDSSEGVAVSPSQYRGRRNLVLVFTGGAPHLVRDWVGALSANTDDLEEENARVLVVIEGTPEEARQLHEELGAPFIFLADCDAEVHRRFAEISPTVVITDRFGEIYSVHRGADLPNAADVIASLRHINIMCDE
jgi:peroxiredoxin